MEKVTVSKNQVYELVLANRYPIDKENKFSNLTFPDREGEIDLILETARVYGFMANKKKCLAVFDEITGDEKNLAKPLSPTSKEQLSAVIQLRGSFGLEPKLFLKTQLGSMQVNIFVFHETLVAERHKILAQKLIEEKAVKLFPGCDEEYLYEALLDQTDNYLFEKLQLSGRGLPIYLVEFDEEGLFRVEELGRA